MGFLHPRKLAAIIMQHRGNAGPAILIYIYFPPGGEMVPLTRLQLSLNHPNAVQFITDGFLIQMKLVQNIRVLYFRRTQPESVIRNQFLLLAGQFPIVQLATAVKNLVGVIEQDAFA